MGKLCCDICDGIIEIISEGRGKCKTCGIEYSVERIREKYNNSQFFNSDVNDNYKENLELYLRQFDWSSAEEMCKKILAQNPRDIFAKNAYLELQDLKDYEIKNNTLIKYHGNARKIKKIKIPNGIIDIQQGAFCNDGEVEEFIVPGSIKCFSHIFNYTRINKFVFEEGVEEIASHIYKFYRDKEPKVILPKSLKKIDRLSFYEKRDIGDFEYRYYPYTSYEFPNGTNEALLSDLRKIRGVCQYCGGNFKHSWFSGTSCVYCGRDKDY